MSMTINGSGTITGLTAGGLPDATITQPDLAAGVAGNGPAFSAYLSSGQTISTAVTTTVTWNATSYDTASCFNTSTYRFTPNVAGYYQFNINMQYSNSLNSGEYTMELQKNGARVAILIDLAAATGTYGSQASCLVYANGSTDYFTVAVYQTSGVSKTLGGSATLSLFQGFLARAA